MTIQWTKTIIRMALFAVTGAAAASWGQEPQTVDPRAAQCVACHGIRGISSNPLFPHLAGQRAGYLQRQLEAFHNGERYHPLMTPVAQSLTPEDMAELAQHYSRLGLPAATASGAAARE